MSAIFCYCKRLVCRPKLYRSPFQLAHVVESHTLTCLKECDLQVKKRVEIWELLASKDDGSSCQLEWRRRSKPAVGNLRLSSLNLRPPQQSTNVFFTHILAYHQANSSVTRALLAQLLIQGFIPDLFTFTVLIESYSKDLKYQHAVDAISVQMKAFGIKTNDAFYTTLMYGLFARIELNSIYQLLKELRVKNVQVPFSCYSALADEFRGKKMIKDAELVLTDMQHLKDERFTCFIENLCNDHSGERLHSAINTLRTQMLDLMRMNTLKLNILLSCLCEYGMLEEVVKIFNVYRENGTIELSKIAYSHAMICCCKLGNMVEAIKLFKEMKAQEKDPDFVDYIAVVDGYQRLGRLEYMRTMAAEMEKVGMDWCPSTRREI